MASLALLTADRSRRAEPGFADGSCRARRDALRARTPSHCSLRPRTGSDAS